MDNDRPTKQPFYESNLFWGSASLAGAIVLTVVAAMKHDLRWLLWFAWPLLTLAVYAIVRGHKYLFVITLLGGLISGGGLLLIGRWLEPPTQSARILPTPQPAPSAPERATSPAPISAEPVAPTLHIQQKGKVNTANPGTITGSIKQDGNCNVIQNGGSGNTASPTCNPDPMAITRQYFCSGEALVKDPKGAVLGIFTHEPGYENDFDSMAALERSGDKQGVLDLCTKEREQHPEWPTPILICAIANSNLGNIKAVKQDLSEFDEKKATLVDTHPSLCDQLESQVKQLHSIP